MRYEPVLGAVCHYEYTGDLPEFIGRIGEVGLQWVEYKYDRELIRRGDSSNFAKIRNKLNEYGTGISVHAPFDGLNIADLDDAARSGAVDGMKRSIEYAAEIGADRITIHGGEMRSEDYSDARWRRSREANIESLSTLAGFGEESGVALCLENGSAFERRKLKHAIFHGDMKAINAAVGNRLDYTVDFGHALYFSSNPVHLIDDLGAEKVRMTHLHDNDGTVDSHIEIGRGVLNIDALLRRFFRERWSFPLCLEIKSIDKILSSAKLLHERIEKLKSEVES